MKSLYTAVCLTLLTGAVFADTTTGSPSAGSPDQTFITSAAQGGMAEVMLGKLAMTKASSADTKKFGQQMVKDHTKANKQLMKIAGKEGVTLPTTISDEDQQTYTRLSGLSGTDFDQAYAADMVQDHQKDISEFQQESTSGSDPRVKAFATKNLPVLQMHLQMAQSLPGGNTPGTSAPSGSTGQSPSTNPGQSPGATPAPSGTATPSPQQ